MKYRLSQICAAFVLGLWFTFSGVFALAASNERSVKILQSDANGITLLFTSTDFVATEFEFEGKQLTKFSGGPDFYYEEEGKPQTPFQVSNIGIPLEGNVSLSVLETTQRIFDDVEVMPTPTFKKVDGWPEPEIVFDAEIYDSAQPFPAERVVLGQPEFFRDQRMVRIEVAMAQYLPQKRRLLHYERVVVRLDFSGPFGPGTTQRLRSANEEELYRNILVNYEQAASWRKTRDLQKRTGSRAKFQNRTLYKFAVLFIQSLAPPCLATSFCSKIHHGHSW